MKVLKVLNRIYVHDIEKSVAFYEKLFNLKCNMRIQYSKVDLELAQVGEILILSGTDEALSPFKATTATFLVDSILEYRAFLVENGATIIRDIQQVPTGMNMTVKHIDGSIIEYVEFKTE